MPGFRKSVSIILNGIAVASAIYVYIYVKYVFISCIVMIGAAFALSAFSFIDKETLFVIITPLSYILSVGLVLNFFFLIIAMIGDKM